MSKQCSNPHCVNGTEIKPRSYPVPCEQCNPQPSEYGGVEVWALYQREGEVLICAEPAQELAEMRAVNWGPTWEEDLEIKKRILSPPREKAPTYRR